MVLSSQNIDWIKNLINGSKRKMLLFFLLELFGIFFSLGFVYYSKQAVDVAMSSDKLLLNEILLIVVVFSLLGILAKLISLKISQLMLISLNIKLQKSLVFKQMSSVWAAVKRWHTGDLAVRINSDTGEVVQMIAVTWLTVILTVLKLIAAFVFLYKLDGRLALLLIAISPLFIFSKIFYKKMRKLNTAIKSTESEIGRTIQENLRQRIMIRSLGITGLRELKLSKEQESYKLLRVEAMNFSLITQAILKYLVGVGYLIVFVWGIYQLNNGLITFGTMTAFLQLVALIQTPMVALLGVVPSFIRFGVALNRVVEIDSVEQYIVKEDVVFDAVDSIEFEAVSFSYEDELVIKELSLTVSKGEPIAIMGGSGKGKTTFIRLLLALIKPSSGNIYVNTPEVKHIISMEHNNNFCYVPQGNSLFSGTIKDNLFLNNSFNIDAVKKVLFLSCADFVWDLPNGLDTKVGEGGLGLSEGQAQRIAIARALLKDTSVILFDEATSALDEVTSTVVMERILSLSESKIIVFITHDLHIANMCKSTILIS